MVSCVAILAISILSFKVRLLLIVSWGIRSLTQGCRATKLIGYQYDYPQNPLFLR